jgi:hypothetical protein
MFMFLPGLSVHAADILNRGGSFGYVMMFMLVPALLACVALSMVGPTISTIRLFEKK